MYKSGYSSTSVHISNFIKMNKGQDKIFLDLYFFAYFDENRDINKIYRNVWFFCRKPHFFVVSWYSLHYISFVKTKFDKIFL